MHTYFPGPICISQANLYLITLYHTQIYQIMSCYLYHSVKVGTQAMFTLSLQMHTCFLGSFCISQANLLPNYTLSYTNILDLELVSLLQCQGRGQRHRKGTCFSQELCELCKYQMQGPRISTVTSYSLSDTTASIGCRRPRKKITVISQFKSVADTYLFHKLNLFTEVIKKTGKDYLYKTRVDLPHLSPYSRWLFFIFSMEKQGLLCPT